MAFMCRVCYGPNYERNVDGSYYCETCGVRFIKPDLFSLPNIKCQFIGPNAKLPEKNKELDSGYDLFAAEEADIEPGTTVMVKTNIAIELPPVFEAQVRARSGLAKKKGIQVANSPGTIDNGYRNNVGILLYNSSDDWFKVEIGDRIAQLVPGPAAQPGIEQVQELSDSDRGLTGFGDSGVSGSIKN